LLANCTSVLPEMLRVAASKCGALPRDSI
jgi:hypothetical protein